MQWNDPHPTNRLSEEMTEVPTVTGHQQIRFSSGRCGENGRVVFWKAMSSGPRNKTRASFGHSRQVLQQIFQVLFCGGMLDQDVPSSFTDRVFGRHKFAESASGQTEKPPRPPVD
jgi:hypothetical protein